MDDQPQDMGHEQHEQVLAEDDMGALAGEMAADAECATEDGVSCDLKKFPQQSTFAALCLSPDDTYIVFFKADHWRNGRE